MIRSWKKFYLFFFLGLYILGILYFMQSDKNDCPSEIKRLPRLYEGLHGEYGPGDKGTGISVSQSDLEGSNLKEFQNGYKQHLFNEFVSNLIPLRRRLPDTLVEKECFDFKYDNDLPDVSVIIPFREEAWSTLLRTVHSVLDRSPPHLLREVILVDDGSTFDHLKRKLNLYISSLPKVILIRLPESKGLMTSRQTGINKAVADAIIVMDSHVEVATGWLEPLLQRIKDDPNVMVFPKIGAVNGQTFAVTSLPTEDEVMLPTFDFFMAEISVPTREDYMKSRPHRLSPIKAPGVQGMAFGINRKFFQRLGGFDLGMKVWGAEQYELSVKVWQCGGSIEMVPCSHVVHVFRDLAWNNDIMKKKAFNNDRVIDVWMDEYKKTFYEMSGNKTTGQAGDIQERLKIKKDNNCKTFQFFLDSIRQYVHYYVPEHIKAKGALINKGTNLCMDGRVTDAFPGDFVLAYSCHFYGGTQYWEISKDDELRHGNLCCKKEEDKVAIKACKHRSFTKWTYRQNGQVAHQESGLCLTVETSGQPLKLLPCVDSDSQIWFMHRIENK